MMKVLGKVLLSVILGAMSFGSIAQMQANGCGPGGQVTMNGGFGLPDGYCVYTDGSCASHPAGNIPSFCHWNTEPPHPPKPDQFGAVAWNTETGVYDTSVNRRSRAEAERVALQKCGDGCKVYTWYKNQCVGTAEGRLPGGYLRRRIEADPQRSRAEQKALASCGEEVKNCQLVFSECSF